MSHTTIAFGGYELPVSNIIQVSPIVELLTEPSFCIWVTTVAFEFMEMKFPFGKDTAKPQAQAEALQKLEDLRAAISRYANVPANSDLKGYVLTHGGITVPVYAIDEILPYADPQDGQTHIPVKMKMGQLFPFPFPLRENIATNSYRVLDANPPFPTKEEVMQALSLTLNILQAELDFARSTTVRRLPN